MLFWLILIALFIGITVIAVTDDYSWWNLVGGTFFAIGLLGTAVSLIFFALNYCSIDANIARNQKLYEMLVYQFENDIYENDNDIGKIELMEKITDWNTDLAANRELQDNFWVGIYLPDIYDQFEFIDVEGLG